MRYIAEKRQCPSCEKVNRGERMALCRTCWRSAPIDARRAHWRVYNAWRKGTASMAQLLESIERLAERARESRFGLELALR